MAQRKVDQPVRQQRRTALLVGEGLAEQTFLNHLKALYVLRGHKQVTVKNAKGKGGAHVLDYTRRQGLQAAFDEKAALLDTDTDWDDKQRALAREWGIEVIEAQPCLEALLLRIAGQRVPHGTEACKKAFTKQFGAPAHEAAVLERHFTRAMLDNARPNVPALDQLMQFLLR